MWFPLINFVDKVWYTVQNKASSSLNPEHVDQQFSHLVTLTTSSIHPFKRKLSSRSCEAAIDKQIKLFTKTTERGKFTEHSTLHGSLRCVRFFRPLIKRLCKLVHKAEKAWKSQLEGRRKAQSIKCEQV